MLSFVLPLLSMLSGKKTVAVAIAMGVLQSLYGAGVIDHATYEAIFRICEALGLVAVRAAIGWPDPKKSDETHPQ